MSLTKREIDALTHDPSGPPHQILWDETGSGKGHAAIPGFGVRVFPSGNKSFVLRWRNPDRLLTLGRYGSELTLTEARDRARSWRVMLRDGIDPLAERDRQRDEARAAKQAAITFDDFADRWLEKYAKAHRSSWREDERRLARWVRPYLGSAPIADVTPADIAALHSRIGKKAPVEANRVVQLVRAIFNVAIAWEDLPADHRNPAQVSRSPNGAAVRAFKERSREVYIEEDEMPSFLEALEAEADEMRALYRLILLTGCRKSEILGAKWENVNAKRGELVLGGLGLGEWRGAAKEGGRVVYLSDEAITTIEGLKRRDGSPYLFPAVTDPDRLRDGRSTKIRNSWRRIRKASGLEHVTIHDLRRTAGSWLGNLGYSKFIIDKALGHATDDDVSSRYTRITAKTAREALNAYAVAVRGAGRNEPGSVCEDCGADDHRAGAEFCYKCGGAVVGVCDD